MEAKAGVVILPGSVFGVTKRFSHISSPSSAAARQFCPAASSHPPAVSSSSTAPPSVSSPPSASPLIPYARGLTWPACSVRRRRGRGRGEELTLEAPPGGQQQLHLTCTSSSRDSSVWFDWLISSSFLLASLRASSTCCFSLWGMRTRQDPQAEPAVAFPVLLTSSCFALCSKSLSVVLSSWTT